MARGEEGALSPKDDFRSKLAELAAAKKPRGPSPARTHIRSNFDAITEARGRGVSWEQIADLMKAEGFLTAEGKLLTADAVRSLYHVEKYANGGKRKRNPRLLPDKDSPRNRRGQPVTPETPAPAPAALPPAPKAEPSDAERAERLRAAMARPARKPFPTGSGFQVPDDPNWRTKKGDDK